MGPAAGGLKRRAQYIWERTNNGAGGQNRTLRLIVAEWSCTPELNWPL